MNDSLLQMQESMRKQMQQEKEEMQKQMQEQMQAFLEKHTPTTEKKRKSRSPERSGDDSQSGYSSSRRKSSPHSSETSFQGSTALPVSLQSYHIFILMLMYVTCYVSRRIYNITILYVCDRLGSQ